MLRYNHMLYFLGKTILLIIAMPFIPATDPISASWPWMVLGSFGATLLFGALDHFAAD